MKEKVGHCKECGQSPEAREGKAVNCLTESPGRTGALPTLDCCSVRLALDF